MAHRFPLLSLSFVSLTLLASSLSGCGGNNSNNLASTTQSAAQLDEPASGSIELILPTRAGVPQELPIIQVRSTGRRDLTINNVEWVGEKPSRVFMGSERQENVSEDACDSEIYFSASQVCIPTGPPEFDNPYGNGTSYTINLYVSAYEPGDANIIECPEPGADVPDEFRDRYCGAILVETDGLNSGTRVTEGDITVYLQADKSSGAIEIDQASLSFQNVKIGFVASREFNIINASDSEDLTVETVSVSDLGSLLSIQGAEDAPFVLSPSESRTLTFDVDLTDAIEGDINLLSNKATTPVVRIVSSAPNSPTELNLVFDTSISTPPILLSDVETLSFAQSATQEFTLTNPGDTPATVNGVRFEYADPTISSAYYALTLEDAPFEQGEVEIIRESSMSNPDRNVQTFGVTYTPPADGSSPLATMVVSYNYFEGDISKNGEVRIVLLGSQENVAFARLTPEVLNFSTQSSEPTQSRTVVLQNLGNAPLTLSGMFNLSTPQLGSTDEFTITTPTGTPLDGETIAPGASKEITVTFTDTDMDADRFTATLDSNTGQGSAIELTILSVNVAPAAETIEVETSFVDNATVGELVVLSLVDTLPRSIALSTEWVMLEKPAASSLKIKTRNDSVGFIPDVAGSYAFLLTANNGSVDIQTVYSFRVE